MATISIQGSTIGCGFGFGCFSELAVSFESARDSAGNLVSALGQLKEKIDLADVETNVESTYTDVSESKLREETKSGALSNVYKKLEEFITDIGSVDAKAANRIEDRKDDFYERYYYLKPECEKTTKEHIKDYLQNCSDFMGSAIEYIGKIAIAVGEWIAEHWKELVAGLVLIVIGAVITVCTGGTALAALLPLIAKEFVKGLIIVTLSSVISSSISSDITYKQYKNAGFSEKTAKKNAGKKFGDELASNFVKESIGFMVGSGINRWGSKISGVVPKPNLLSNQTHSGVVLNGIISSATSDMFSSFITETGYYCIDKYLFNNENASIDWFSVAVNGVTGGIKGGIKANISWNNVISHNIDFNNNYKKTTIDKLTQQMRDNVCGKNLKVNVVSEASKSLKIYEDMKAFSDFLINSEISDTSFLVGSGMKNINSIINDGFDIGFNSIGSTISSINEYIKKPVKIEIDI